MYYIFTLETIILFFERETAIKGSVKQSSMAIKPGNEAKMSLNITQKLQFERLLKLYSFLTHCKNQSIQIFINDFGHCIQSISGYRKQR